MAAVPPRHASDGTRQRRNPAVAPPRWPPRAAAPSLILFHAAVARGCPRRYTYPLRYASAPNDLHRGHAAQHPPPDARPVAMGLGRRRAHRRRQGASAASSQHREPTREGDELSSWRRGARAGVRSVPLVHGLAARVRPCWDRDQLRQRLPGRQDPDLLLGAAGRGIPHDEHREGRPDQGDAARLQAG